MKDYYSLEEKKTYYRWRQFKPTLSETQKSFAKKRYAELKNSEPKKYKPKYTIANKPYFKQLKLVLNNLKKRRDLYNWLDDPKHRYVISQRHTKFNSEIKRLESFRHKHKISLDDTIYIEKSNPPPIQAKSMKGK